MIFLIKTIQFYLFAHRKAALSVCGVLCCLMAYVVSQLKLEENILDLLPLGNESVRNYAEVLHLFQASDNMVFMVKLIPKASHVDLVITAADKLAEALKADPLVRQVQYRWDVGEINEAINVLRPFHADLFTAEDEQSMTEVLTYGSLDRMLGGWKRLLQEIPAPFLSQQLSADPLGMDRLFLQKLESMQSLDNTTIIDNGIVFSSDKRSLLLSAIPKIPGTDSQRGKMLVKEIEHTIESITREVPGVEISWLSGHRFTIDNASSIKRDVSLVAGISIVVISILCLLVFSRIYFVLLALVPAIFGVLTAASCVVFFRSTLSAIVLGLGGVLVAITVDYGLHVLYRIDQQAQNPPAAEIIVQMVSRIVSPLLLCAGTTLAAFFVLIFSSFPGYSQLGWFSVIGIAAAVIFVLFVLPLLITGKNKGRKARIPLPVFFDYYRKITVEHRRGWMLISILISLLALPGLLHLHFDREIENLNMVSPAVRRDWDSLKTAFPGVINSSFIILKGENKEIIFEQSEKLVGWLKNYGNGDRVTTAAASWLYPSEKTRLENRNRWKAFWNPDRKNRLIKDFTEISKKYGMKPSFFLKRIEQLPGSMPPYDIKTVLAQPLIGQILSNQLHINQPTKYVLMPFSLRDSNHMDDFERHLKISFPGAFVSNSGEFLKNIIQLIFFEFVKLGCLALLATLTILFLFTRNITHTVGFFLPLFQAMVFTFGLMGWIRMPLTIMSVLVIIFIFGLVVDYSLFLGHTALKGGSGFSQTGGAITISALTTLCGLGALTFAEHPALHSIGATALLGVGSGFFFTMLNYGWVWERK